MTNYNNHILLSGYYYQPPYYNMLPYRGYEIPEKRVPHTPYEKQQLRPTVRERGEKSHGRKQEKHKPRNKHRITPR